MRLINVYCASPMAPFAAFALLAGGPLCAQQADETDAAARAPGVTLEVRIDGVVEEPAAVDAADPADVDGDPDDAFGEDPGEGPDDEFAYDLDADAGQLPETPQDRLARLFKLYKDAVNDGMFAEADTLAKQIVELTIATSGLDSRDSARAITNLAIAQHGAGDYESALLNFTAAIDITERISDRLNEDLINPLKGLAASHLALGNTGAAAETFQRATHISHVNFGPHNLDQIEILESLAETFLAAGEYDQAVDMQERIFLLQARNVDADSEEILPALRTQARWLHRLALYDKERYVWRRIISILEDSRGRDDLSLIQPLTGLGESYLYVVTSEVSYHQPVANTTGEIYLKRALRIAEENPDSNWEIRAQAMLALADYYILTERPSRAERVYAETWELLSAEDERHSSRDTELQSLTVLQHARPPRFYGIESGVTPPRRPDGFETGTVVYEYSISERGRPTNIELVTAEPAALEDMEQTVARELRRIVQRPRIVDGDTVQTDNLTFTHTFYYRESDLPEVTTAADGSRD